MLLKTKSNWKNSLFRVLLINLLLFSHHKGFSQADSLNFQTDRFSASFGGFYTGLGSSVIVGVDQLGLGISLELEDALGLESSAFVLRGDATYTFGKKRNKQLSLGYIGLLRKASRTLGRDVEIGDQVFDAKTVIETRFNLEIYKLSYNWGFFKDERMRLGLGGGLFIMPIGFSIGVQENQSIGVEARESDFFQFIAPLPALGVTTDFYIGPRWTFSQSLDLFYIQIADFQGALTDFNLKLEYRPLDHFAFGTGVNTFRLNIVAKDEISSRFDFKGSVESSYTGVLFYAKYLIKYKN
jgi:hypothetical protein